MVCDNLKHKVHLLKQIFQPDFLYIYIYILQTHNASNAVQQFKEQLLATEYKWQKEILKTLYSHKTVLLTHFT